MGNTPNIRFAGFTDDWEQRKLAEILEKYEDPVETPHDGYERLGIRSHAKGIFHSYVEAGKELETAKMHRVAADKFIVNITFAWEHAVAITDKEDAGKLVSHRFPQFSFDPKLKSHFFKYQMLDERFRKHLELSSPGGAGRNRVLKVNEMLEYQILLPTVEEQNKIGEFFDNLDNLITLHQRKCDETKELKKFMLQKMFPKNGVSKPEIRFAGFTDDWEQRKLGEISDKVTKKNQDAVVDEVFTNSAEFGIISQRDFFEKDIANAKNIDGYYVVEPDDFVYNPRISTTAPFGPIKRNKLERTGAMSPLYYVFRPYDIDLSYLEWYFQTTCWHAFMRFNGNSGARSDRFAITDKIFNEMPISMPQDIVEQKLIGTFLTKLESLITLHQRKCDNLKEVKKYMLQNMFPQKG